MLHRADRRATSHRRPLGRNATAAWAMACGLAFLVSAPVGLLGLVALLLIVSRQRG
jgi:hypothetical protein